MRICVFCHDAYMSGANMSMADWINSDFEDDILLVIPHRNKEIYKSFFRPLDIICGNYFCLCRELTYRPAIYKIKKAIKILYTMAFKKYIMLSLKKRISNWEPDVIISNSFSVLIGAEMAKQLEKTHIWHIREFMESDHGIQHYNDRLTRELCRNSHAIYISESIREYYQEKYVFKSDTIVYDQIQFEGLGRTVKNIFGSQTIKIIMVGILSENKGQSEAIEAVKLLHKKGYQIILDIFGSGPDEKRLMKLINGVNYITLKGYSKELYKEREKYDIALICSKNEALGRATIEAMYYGNLVIGANSGCTSILLGKEENGLLYETGNAEMLANKIIYAIENKKVMELKIDNAYKYVKRTFNDPIADKIREFICNSTEGKDEN